MGPQTPVREEPVQQEYQPEREVWQNAEEPQEHSEERNQAERDTTMARRENLKKVRADLPTRTGHYRARSRKTERADSGYAEQAARQAAEGCRAGQAVGAEARGERTRSTSDEQADRTTGRRHGV